MALAWPARPASIPLSCLHACILRPCEAKRKAKPSCSLPAWPWHGLLGPHPSPLSCLHACILRPHARPNLRASLAVACLHGPGMVCTSTILLSYSWMPCACMFTCPQCCAQAPRCPHGLRCPVHACTFTRQVHVPHCPHSLGCPVRAGIHPHSCLHSF